MKREPDRNPYARRRAFTRLDPISTEVEVTRFIADVVRAFAPLTVVETGTGHGSTAMFIAEALGLNAVRGVGGHLYTFETDPERATAARKLLPPNVTVYERPVQEWTPPAPVDLAFVDSAFGSRMADVEHLAPHMAPQGLVFVHDAALDPVRPMVETLIRFYGWPVISLPTPRGLVLLQVHG